MRELLLAIFKTGSGALINLLLGAISTKIIAVNLGPSGIGLLSLLRHTRDSTRMLTTLNGSVALVQGISSRQRNDTGLFIQVVFLVMFLTSVLATGFLLLFAPTFARFVFQDQRPEMVALIRWLAIPTILTTGNVFLEGVLNGFRAIGRLALITIASAVTTVLFSYPLVILVRRGYSMGYVGLLSFSAITGLLLAYFLLRRAGWFALMSPIWKTISWPVFKETASHFLSFAFTTLVVGLASTWTLLTIRAFVVRQGGLSSAGIFEAAWTLCMLYLTLVLESFGTYYLPTLSQMRENIDRQSLIGRVLHVTILLVVPVILGVVLLKPLVIKVLYSSEFLPALSIIRWMLIGDYLKAISWVFGISIKSLADKKTLFWVNISWDIGMLGLSALSLGVFNSLEYIGFAYGLLYALNLLFTSYYAYRRFNFLPSKDIIIKFIAGFILIIAASLQTWSNGEVNWLWVIIWAVIAILYTWFVLNPEQRLKIRQVVERVSISGL